jgi:hypothetical protein
MVDDPTAVSLAQAAQNQVNTLNGLLRQGAMNGTLNAQQQQDDQTYISCHLLQGVYATRAVPASATLNGTRQVEWIDGQSVQAGVWKLSLVSIPAATWQGGLSSCPILGWNYDSYQVARDFDRDTGAIGFGSQTDPNAIVGVGYTISASGVYGESAPVYINVNPNGLSGTIVGP